MKQLLAAAFVLAAMTLGSIGYAQSPAKPYKLSSAEIKHLHYIVAHTHPVIPHKLNLADPEQYAYVIETLGRAGITPKTDPEMFKAIGLSRNGPSGMPIMMKTADLPEDSGGAVLGGVNYTSKFGTNSSNTYSNNSISTYPSTQIPANTSIVTALIDMDNNIVLNQNNAAGKGTTNIQSGTSAPAPSDHADIQSNTMFGIQAKPGGAYNFYSVILEDFAAISDACQLSPGYSPTIDVSQQCETSAATTCVNANLPSRAMKVCYGNRIQSDCDYGCEGSSNPPNIIFPVKGSVNLGRAPATPLTGTLYIALTSVNGGGCVLEATANTSGSLQNLITMNGNVASWNFPPANFPNTNCLQPTASGTLFNYLFQLFMMTPTGAVGVTYTSDSTQWGNLDTVAVPQMNVLIGCLPAGVEVRMADGSQKTIESFHGQEIVRSTPMVEPASSNAADGAEAFTAITDDSVRSARSNTRAVTATMTGSESIPLVSIRDDHGHSLMLTVEHPVMTPDGAVKASTLKVGDRILTESGVAVLVGVSRESSPRPVPIYNLAVGTEAEAAQQQTTFYANGILVGDQQMQQYMANHPSFQSTPATPEWQGDLFNPLPMN